jgi:hypothetical protein
MVSADDVWPGPIAPRGTEGLNGIKELVVGRPTLDAAAIERFVRILATALPAK